MKISKKIAFAALALAAPAHGQTCSDASVEFRDLMLFEACHCATHPYDELAPLLARHGLKLNRRGSGVGWREEIAGKTWSYCSISLNWVDGASRRNPEKCGDENRKRVVAEVKSALKYPVMINTPSLACY